MSLICFVCHNRTGEDGVCFYCDRKHRRDRNAAWIAVGIIVSILVAAAVVKLWAVDWDVKCWISDKCRRGPGTELPTNEEGARLGNEAGVVAAHGGVGLHEGLLGVEG